MKKKKKKYSYLKLCNVDEIWLSQLLIISPEMGSLLLQSYNLRCYYIAFILIIFLLRRVNSIGRSSWRKKIRNCGFLELILVEWRNMGNFNFFQVPLFYIGWIKCSILLVEALRSWMWWKCFRSHMFRDSDSFIWSLILEIDVLQ